MSGAEIAGETSADRKRPALPRRRFFNDMPDKGLFGLVALLGFVGIFALKVLTNQPDLIAAAAVALMILYGFVAFRIPDIAVRPDRLGDNFYYLGFIFTLASLSAALYQLRSGIDGDAILGSFGIALVTTIVGIAGRVMFVQMRDDLDEIEKQARRDLAATSAELRGQLLASIRELETLRTSYLQSLQETSAACAEASKKQIEVIEGLTRMATQRIETSLDANRSQMDRVSESMQGVAGAVEAVSRRAAEIKLPSDELNAQVSAFAKELQTHLLRLGAVVDEVARRAQAPRPRWYWPFKSRRSGSND